MASSKREFFEDFLVDLAGARPIWDQVALVWCRFRRPQNMSSEIPGRHVPLTRNTEFRVEILSTVCWISLFHCLVGAWVGMDGR